MNEFFKKLVSRIGSLWAGWSIQQKLILAVVVIVAIGGVVALFRVSASPSFVSVIDAPIKDETALDRIVLRLNQENVRVMVTPNGLVQVPDEATARRMRGILIREDLIPSGIDPWSIFDRDRWSITDFERNVNFQRAQRQMIINHIKALDEVDDVNLNIVWPEPKLFSSEQNPASASVIITPKPGSDLNQPTGRKKIEGIQKLLKFSIEGLLDENIVITDHLSNQLNDFEGMAASDRLSLIERENKFIRDMEKKYSTDILSSLQGTYSRNRVKVINIKFDIDMSKKLVDSERITPIMIKEPTPGLPYDDSIRLESILAGESTATTTWKGTGIMPEGPGGVEGQAPPAFKDMQNLYGEMEQVTRVHNQVWNQDNIKEERSPQIDRVTVSVNIDGTWKWKYDEKKNPIINVDGTIEREYTPIPEEQLRRAQVLVQAAIGYNPARGDSVVVQNIPFDRTEEHKEEDAAYFRKKQIQTTIIVFISGLTLLLFGFILFRTISREMERRRRLAEEERARREQMLRESAMAEAEQEGMDVSISLEERTRMELMESVINMAKEHPEDAAQLIRTWILEE